MTKAKRKDIKRDANGRCGLLLTSNRRRSFTVMASTLDTACCDKLTNAHEVGVYRFQSILPILSDRCVQVVLKEADPATQPSAE
jgi:hypothetical protein